MFRIACGRVDKACWGIQPSEFWRMCPQEWWWLYEANVGSDLKDKQETSDRLKRLYFDATKGKTA